MTCTEEYKEHIEYTFHAFCKIVIRNASYTALRTWSRKHKREISLDYITDEKHYPLGTTDEYFKAPEPDEEYIVHLCGDTVILSNGLLVQALSRLPAQKQEMLYQLMKKHGHYCKVCGEYKANEKFSGKGHAAHICKSCASLPAEKQAELMTLNRLLNLPWGLSKEQLSWLKNRLKDRRPDVRALAQEQYEMRFPPKHLEDDKFKFFDEESFIE